MNKDYIKFTTTKLTEFRRSPQVKSSKAQIYTKFHKIPEINFEDRQLTPFSGIIIFQLFFKSQYIDFVILDKTQLVTFKKNDSLHSMIIIPVRNKNHFSGSVIVKDTICILNDFK